MTKHAGEAVFVLLLTIATGLAQVSTSRITGTVHDSSGSAVPGAAVSALNEGTGARFSSTTSEAGVYVFEAVPTGAYTIAAEANGFRKFSSRGNVVNIGQPTTVNVQLEVGPLTESVEVFATAELVQTSTSGNTGNIISEDIIKDMPIVGTRGRNPLDLVLLQPGVASGANTGSGYHIHGARDRAWNYTLDGIDNNDTSMGGGNFAPTRTNPDSVAEFRVITSSPTAELGRNSGANVVLVTKSGTNEYHGSGFWFYRTPRLNANEWVNNFNGTGKRMFVQNIYGGGIGGPILKNRTFFFANIQRLYAVETRSVDRLVYTADARKGILRYVAGGRNRPAGTTDASVDFSGNPTPGLAIKSYNVAAGDPQHIGLDPTIKKLVEDTPLPNRFTGGDGLNTAYFSWASPAMEKQQDNVVRVDHIFSPRNTVFFRAAWGYQNTVCDAGNAGTAFFPGWGCNVDTNRDPRNLAASWRINPTPRLTNEFTVGESQFTFDFISPLAKPGDIFFNGGDGGSTVSNSPGAAHAPVVVANLSYAVGNLRTLRTRQFVDNLSYVREAHTIKGGFNLRYLNHNDTRGSIAGENANQTITFDPGINTVDPATFGIPSDLNVANDRPFFQRNINFLLGRVGRISRGFASNGQRYVDDLYRVTGQYRELEFYVQDTWKVRKNLTIDLGLRWEARLAPQEKNGIIAHPDQLLVRGAAPTNTARWVRGSFYKDDWKNLGPSIGFAWDPFGTGKTSVRSNYRIAYDRLPTFGLSSAIFQSLPGITLAGTNESFGQGGGRLPNLPKLTPPDVDPASLAQPAAFANVTMTVRRSQYRDRHHSHVGFRRPARGHGQNRRQLSTTSAGARTTSTGPTTRTRRIFSAMGSSPRSMRRKQAARARCSIPLLRRTHAAARPSPGRRSCGASLRASFQLNSVAAVANSLATRIQSGRNITDLGRPRAVLLHPESAVRERHAHHRLQRFLDLPRPGGADRAPLCERRFRAIQLDLVQIARYPLLRSGPDDLLDRQQPVREQHPVRRQQPQAELCALGFRPAAHLSVQLGMGAALRTRAQVRKLREFGAGPHRRRLASRRLPALPDGPPVHRLLGVQHTVERRPESGELRGLLLLGRQGVHRRRAEVLLLQGRARSLQHARARRSRQHRPEPVPDRRPVRHGHRAGEGHPASASRCGWSFASMRLT